MANSIGYPVRDSKRSLKPDTEDYITFYYRELDESPPRAAIALASAHFDERLLDAILVRFNRLRGSQNPLKFSRKEKEDLKKAVPRSLHARVQLGYGMGIFPSTDTTRAIEKALRVRNLAIHLRKPLDSKEKKDIERAIQFFHQMAVYLVGVRVYSPELDREGPPIPPAYPD